MAVAVWSVALAEDGRLRELVEAKLNKLIDTPTKQTRKTTKLRMARIQDWG